MTDWNNLPIIQGPIQKQFGTEFRDVSRGKCTVETVQVQGQKYDLTALHCLKDIGQYSSDQWTPQHLWGVDQFQNDAPVLMKEGTNQPIAYLQCKQFQHGDKANIYVTQQNRAPIQNTTISHASRMDVLRDSKHLSNFDNFFIRITKMLPNLSVLRTNVGLIPGDSGSTVRNFASGACGVVSTGNVITSGPPPEAKG